MILLKQTAYAAVLLVDLTTSTHRPVVPSGYVAATVYATTPEGQHAVEVFVPRRYCHLRVPAFVDRDGTLLSASAGVLCR